VCQFLFVRVNVFICNVEDALRACVLPPSFCLTHKHLRHPAHTHTNQARVRTPASQAILLHGCAALQRTATHCNTLQHTATHCNTLPYAQTRTRAFKKEIFQEYISWPRCAGLQCNTLQYTVTSIPALTRNSSTRPFYTVKKQHVHTLAPA